MGCSRLLNLPVHTLPCSNLAVEGNNGTTEYHDITDQTITEPTPCRVSLLEPGIPDWMGVLKT
jgi:hypothetical protein